MPVYRATLVTFDPATYTASLRLDGSQPQTLDAVNVAANIPPGELVAGRVLLLDTGDHGDVADALVFSVAGLGLDRPAILDRATSTVSVASSTTKTDVYSYSVPASILSTNKSLQLTLLGDYLNNGAATSTLTVEVRFGATTLWADVTAANAINAAVRPFYLQATLANLGATNSQLLTGLLALATTTAATTGQGDVAAVATLANPLAGTAAEDTTAAKTLAVAVTHQQSHANTRFRRLYASLELL